MNIEQITLVKLIEECQEVSQRATKAIRFGLGEIQPGQSLTNQERLQSELLDFMAALEKLIDIGAIEEDIFHGSADVIEERKKRIDKYNSYSKELGILKQ